MTVGPGPGSPAAPPENVRPIPQGDPDFARLYARRNDAESINRALNDILSLWRAHSVGTDAS